LKLKTWKEVPIGGLITDAGNSVQYETGGWRANCPVIDAEKCSHCMLCWVYCPEGAIRVEDDKVVGIDLTHCKGCGICARECPRKAVTMGKEAAVKEGVKV